MFSESRKHTAETAKAINKMECDTWYRDIFDLEALIGVTISIAGGYFIVFFSV